MAKRDPAKQAGRKPSKSEQMTDEWLKSQGLSDEQISEETGARMAQKITQEELDALVKRSKLPGEQGALAREKLVDLRNSGAIFEMKGRVLTKEGAKALMEQEAAAPKPAAAAEPETPKAPAAAKVPEKKPMMLGKKFKVEDVTQDNLQEIIDRGNKGDQQARRILMDLRDAGDQIDEGLMVGQSGGQWGRVQHGFGTNPSIKAGEQASPVPGEGTKVKLPPAQKAKKAEAKPLNLQGQSQEAKAKAKGVARVEPRVADVAVAPGNTGEGRLSSEQVAKMRSTLRKNGVEEKKFLSAMGVKQLDDLPQGEEGRKRAISVLEELANTPTAKTAAAVAASSETKTAPKGPLNLQGKAPPEIAGKKTVDLSEIQGKNFGLMKTQVPALSKFLKNVNVSKVEKDRLLELVHAQQAISKLPDQLPTPEVEDLKAWVEEMNRISEAAGKGGTLEAKQAEAAKRAHIMKAIGSGKAGSAGTGLHGRVMSEGRIRNGVFDLSRDRRVVRENIREQAREARGTVQGTVMNRIELNKKGIQLQDILRKRFGITVSKAGTYSGAQKDKLKELFANNGIPWGLGNKAVTPSQLFGQMAEGDVAKLNKLLEGGPAMATAEAPAQPKGLSFKSTGEPEGIQAAPEGDMPEGGSKKPVTKITTSGNISAEDAASLRGRLQEMGSNEEAILRAINKAEKTEYATLEEVPNKLKARINTWMDARSKRPVRLLDERPGGIPGPVSAAPGTAPTPAGGAPAAPPPSPAAGGAAPPGGAPPTGAAAAGTADDAARAAGGMAGRAGKLASLMRFLGPLAAVYGAYELASGLHGATIGAEDEKRLRVLEALGGVTGGIRQDQQMQTAVAQQRAAVELAGIQRQQELDAMRNQYTQNQALNSLVRGNEQLLAAIAQPSRPTMAELMAGLR